MKHVRLLLLSVCYLSVTAGRAQAPPPLCDCAQVMEDRRKYPLYAQTEAQRIINEYCKSFKNPARINPRPYACTSVIYAQLCDDGQKYIFYNASFLDRLLKVSQWGDKFVLAHEIAHHLLGHTERAYRLGMTQESALNSVYTGTDYTTKNKKGTQRAYTVSIPQRHLHELEADALGLWMLMRTGTTRATRTDMNQIFDALPTLLSVYGGKSDAATSTDFHPSLNIRRTLIDRYWTAFEKPTAANRYLTVRDSTLFTPLRRDIEEFYVYQLLSANAERQAQFTETERGFRDSLTRRSRFPVDVVVGGMAQQPVLRRGSDPVAATGGQNLTAGLRFGLGAWYRTHRVETDVTFASTVFTTQAEFGDGQRTIEAFKSRYIYVQPRYVYTCVGRTSRVAYRTGLWLATAGLSASIPLSFQYTNYTASAYPAVAQRTGFAPVAGIGYGLSNWLSRNGHFRLWLLYRPQPVRLAVDASERVRARLHTLSLDFSVRFW